MNRFEDSYSINLYSLFAFYVEAWYNPDSNEIEKFRTFKSVNALEPYADRVELKI